jgi:hypothetical protein
MDSVATTRSGLDSEPVVGFRLVGVDNHIVALADLDSQFVGDELFDGDEVAGDDSEWLLMSVRAIGSFEAICCKTYMAVHGDMECAIDSGIYEADTVAFALDNVDSGVLPVVVC